MVLRCYCIRVSQSPSTHMTCSWCYSLILNDVGDQFYRILQKNTDSQVISYAQHTPWKGKLPNWQRKIILWPADSEQLVKNFELLHGYRERLFPQTAIYEMYRKRLHRLHQISLSLLPVKKNKPIMMFSSTLRLSSGQDYLQPSWLPISTYSRIIHLASVISLYIILYVRSICHVTLRPLISIWEGPR